MKNLTLSDLSLSDLLNLKIIHERKLRQAEIYMEIERGRDLDEYLKREMIYSKHESHSKIKQIKFEIEKFINI
jgi:hypothetical protein